MKKILLVALSILLIFTVGCESKSNIGSKKSGNKSNHVSVNSSQENDIDPSDSYEDANTYDDAEFDTDGLSSYEFNDTSNSDDEITAFGEIIPSVNTSKLMRPLSGGYDSQAEVLRNKVILSQDALNITGKKYYVSMNGDDSNNGLSPKTAWQTIDAVVINSFLFEKGDAILFERGGVYRQTTTFRVNSDITFGAYGTGNKPAIYGSQKNYSDYSLWEASRKKNVWKMSLYTNDAGNIIFNHGEFVGNKKTGLLNMTKNGDFYHNREECCLYLYLDKGNPAKVYKSIEIGTLGDIFEIYEGAKNVVFDNLCIKYGGSNAISTQGHSKNIIIKNCEIGWIGGSLKNAALDPEMRYGSGILFNSSTEDCVVSNNWVYQCFDDGISFQGGSTGDTNKYSNLKFTDNICEYNTNNMELWDTVLTSTYANVSINNNILRFAGFGWAEQRTDEKYASQIYIGDLYDSSMVNFSISNNILDYSNSKILFWGNQLSYKGDLRLEGLTCRNNSVYQKKIATTNLLVYAEKNVLVSNQTQLLDAVKIFDVSPKEVVWSEK